MRRGAVSADVRPSGAGREEMSTRNAILGSTGSNGRNALEVIDAAGAALEVGAGTDNRRICPPARQCR